MRKGLEKVTITGLQGVFMPLWRFLFFLGVLVLRKSGPNAN
jgi:hypothetical protein